MVETQNASVESFEAEALPHFDDLYRTAVRVIGDREIAEDLVQETYLEAWKSFRRFEPGTNCRAWLFKILFHVIHHHRRKWFRFKFTREDEALLEQTLVYEPPIPQDITDEDMLAALDRVPQNYREVLLLADVQEFSYKEVADTLNIPIGTVMSRLSRGRVILRTQLGAMPTPVRADITHQAASSVSI
ncbi:MAG: RNA polymerase sigma factor [Acidobacteria bacterium]|nr:RNA polymerase sigma factor [Acidobacteriota bacterium]MCI0718925.1 RNA polymerase sigma factor [Acidobacteriota bacterium]